MKTKHTLLLGLSAALIAVPVSVFALFNNGGFETGDLTGWTATDFLNTGLTGATPYNGTSIARGSGGTSAVAVVASGTDAYTNNSIAFPRFGNYAARLNWGAQSAPPTQKISNEITQESVMTNADVDPIDGNLHVRLAFAPVLYDGGHSADQQPYVYVGVTNVTRGTTLYSFFAYARQPGVPWKTGSNVDYLYTDWQVVDVAPGPVALQIGDEVQIDTIAAGCSQGGHWGYVYLDAFGSQLPGLYVVGQAPQSVNAGGDITYALTFLNNGTGAAANTVATFTVPDQTTFKSLSDATHCTQASGVVTCNFGTVQPNESHVFDVTVTTSLLATGAITAGNYSVSATGVPALLGPLMTTDISLLPITDLQITVSDNSSTYNAGAPITYTITATNNGPTAVSGATVTNALVAGLNSATWTCVASTGSSCTASGSGALLDSVNLAVNGTATYALTANVASGSIGALADAATIVAPLTVLDSNPLNNAALDTDTLAVRASWSIDTQLSSSTAQPGDTITVTGSVQNTSAVAALAALVSVPLPAGLTYVPGSFEINGAAAADPLAVLSNSFAMLAAGASAQISYQVTVPASVGASFTFAAQVSATNGPAQTGSGVSLSVVDTTAPTATLVVPALTHSATPIIAGTAGDNVGVSVSTLTFSRGACPSTGSYAEAAVVLSAGVFSQPSPALADGTYCVHLAVLDASLNATRLTATLTVDTTPPLPPEILTPLDGSVTGADEPLLITGLAEVGSTVTLTLLGTTYTLNAPLGTFALSLPGPFASGAAQIAATATDIAGNVSPAATANITFDGTAPSSVTILTPARGAFVNGQNGVVVTGHTDAGASVALTVTAPNGVFVQIATADTNGNYSARFGSSLQDGTALVSAIATDAFANSTLPVVQNFMLDSTPPLSPTIAAPIDASVHSPLQSVRVAGTAEVGATITVTIGGVSLTVVADANGNYVLTLPGPFSLGNQTLTVTATDAAGNVSQAADTTLIFDGTAIAILTPTANAPLTDTAVVSVTGSARAGDNVQVTLTQNGVAQIAFVVANGGAYSVQFAGGRQDGSATVTAQDLDNQTEAEVALTFAAAAVAPTVSSSTTASVTSSGYALNAGDAPTASATTASAPSTDSSVARHPASLENGINIGGGGGCNATGHSQDGAFAALVVACFVLARRRKV